MVSTLLGVNSAAGEMKPTRPENSLSGTASTRTRTAMPGLMRPSCGSST